MISDRRTGSAPFAQRRDRLRERLVAESVDVLVVTAPYNVAYLSGFTGSNGAIVIEKHGNDRLVTDARYTERAARQAPGLPVEVQRDFREAVRACAPVKGAVAVEAHVMTWSDVQQLETALATTDVEVVASRGWVEDLRAIKDPDEIAALTRACKITVAALDHVVNEHLRPGVTERQFAIALERAFVDGGADGSAFPSIVASGVNGSIPHHEPGTRPFTEGDLVTIDCGALVEGYHADYTRTIAIGEVAPQLRELYDVVLAAQTAGIGAVIDGAPIGTVDDAARAVITEADYGDYFVHPTGHGVGLQIHEQPTVTNGARATIRPGLVFTVEPGVYVPGVGGIRIEDTVAIGAQGDVEVLTESSRAFRVMPL